MILVSFNTPLHYPYRSAFSNLVRNHLFLRALRTVFGSRLATVIDPGSVKRSADDVILHTRKVFNSAASDKYNRVFLKIMSLSRYIGNHLKAVRQTHFGDFPKGRIRLFRCRRVHSSAYASALRACRESRGFGLLYLVAASFSNQLLNRWHDRYRID